MPCHSDDPVQFRPLVPYHSEQCVRRPRFYIASWLLLLYPLSKPDPLTPET